MGWLADSVRSSWLGPFGSGDRRLRDLWAPSAVDSGVVVTEDRALGLAAFWCAVSLISNTLAGLPLHLYKRVGDEGRERVRDPIAALMALDASDELTAFQFRRALVLNCLVSGNGYAEIVRRRDSREPAALYLLDSALVEVIRDPRTHAIKYRVSGDGETVELSADHILHLAGPGRTGLVGVSVVAQARQALGLALAVESYGAKFFGAGGTPSGVLEHPARLSDPVKKQLRESWEGIHRPGARKLAILEEGMKYHAISLPPEDSQFLSSRNFQTVEVARLFHMPASMLSAAVEGASLTYRNSQEERAAFADLCLAPWALALEQELGKKLLWPGTRGELYFKHRYEALLRAATTERFAAYTSALTNRWMSRNEVRALEDMHPIEGGDTYDMPGSPAAAPATDANLLAGRTLVEATIRRSLKREADRATKAASTLHSLDVWARAFYDEGERVNLTTELVRVIAPFAPPGRDVAALARALATELHTESRRTLADLTIAAPPELRTAVTKLTDHWLTNRPAIAADKLLARLTS